MLQGKTRTQLHTRRQRGRHAVKHKRTHMYAIQNRALERTRPTKCRAYIMQSSTSSNKILTLLGGGGRALSSYSFPLTIVLNASSTSMFITMSSGITRSVWIRQPTHCITPDGRLRHRLATVWKRDGANCPLLSQLDQSPGHMITRTRIHLYVTRIQLQVQLQPTHALQHYISSSIELLSLFAGMGK